MEEKVRYALVEELRTHLPKFMEKPSTKVRERTPAPEPVVELRFMVPTDFDPIAAQIMNERLAGHISGGVVAGRTYGGCSGAGKSYEETLREMGIEGEFGNQDVFGGKAESEKSKPNEDKYGSLTFKCQNGHTNTRPHGELVKYCKVSSCKIDMSCGKEE